MRYQIAFGFLFSADITYESICGGGGYIHQILYGCGRVDKMLSIKAVSGNDKKWEALSAMISSCTV